MGSGDMDLGRFAGRALDQISSFVNKTEKKDPSAPPSVADKCPNSVKTSDQLQQKPTDFKSDPKEFVKSHLQTGSGAALATVGTLASGALLPLVALGGISGGIIGGTVQQLGKLLPEGSLKEHTKNAARLGLAAGVTLGSLGTAGMVVAGLKMMETASQRKPEESPGHPEGTFLPHSESEYVGNNPLFGPLSVGVKDTETEDMNKSVEYARKQLEDPNLSAEQREYYTEFAEFFGDSGKSEVNEMEQINKPAWKNAEWTPQSNPTQPEQNVAGMGRPNRPLTPERREELRAERKAAQESETMQSAPRPNRPLTPERREELRAERKAAQESETMQSAPRPNRPLTPERREELRAERKAAQESETMQSAPRPNRPLTPERREELRAERKAAQESETMQSAPRPNRPLTPERREELRAERKATQESEAMQSAARPNRPLTPERREDLRVKNQLADLNKKIEKAEAELGKITSTHSEEMDYDLVARKLTLMTSIKEMHEEVIELEKKLPR